MPHSLDGLPNVGAPATRALNHAGYHKLRQLAGASRKDLAALHGMGPRAIAVLEAALKEHGMVLRD